MRWTTVVLSVLVAGCGENLVTIDGDGVAKSDEVTKSELVHGTRVHVHPRRDPAAAAVTAAAAPAGAHLTYYGGKIIPNAKVYSVNWGTGVNASYVSQLPGFYQAVTNSPEHWDWIAAEYTTVGLNGQDGLPGSNQAFGRGSFVSTIDITPASTATTISDATIQSEINAQINAGVLPLPDDNVIFMVNFPKGKTITSPDGARSCVAGGFCAYHGTFRRGTQNVYYAVLPSNEAGTGCATGCGSSTVPFNNYTSVASHELIEAATDAEVGIGTTVARPLAWYDSVNGEIADICNATQGTITASNGTVYTVQAEFSNATSSCIVTKTPVGNSFTVAVSPASTSIAAGGTATVTVSTTVTGTAQSVTLSVTGLPAGVTGSFNPATVTAGGSSTLTLTAATSAGAATATYTVTGTGTSLTRTATGSLTVTTTGGSAETVIANGQTIAGQAGAANQQTFYRVDVPAGASLTISTSGGTGDADLYVQFGTRPTTTSYLCRPYKNGNTESCAVASTQAGSYFVMLNGFSAYSGLSISASWTTGGGTTDPTLVRGVPVTAISGAASSQKFWQIDVPAGTTSLQVAISGGTGDADLYLRSGSHPTTATYNCRPYLNGNNETCTITNPTAGKWYVMLRGFTAYSGVTLSAN